MAVQLSDHFTYKKLIRFVLPCVAMMVFTSVYGIVDGYFLSNYAGKNGFAAVNLIMPFIMGLAALGFMIGSGGSALISYYFGRKEDRRAKEVFSMLIYTLLTCGVIVAALGYTFMPQIVDFLGASDIIRQDSIIYGRISMISLPFYMLGNTFQSFLTVAERPKMGLLVSICAGVLNIILDYTFVYKMQLGAAGAASATMLSEFTGGIIPILYFIFPNKSTLRLVLARPDFRDIGKACYNGISELMTNLSNSTVAMIYNMQLIRLAAENGIAAYGVIMYVSFIFNSIHYGYTIGINPLVGYNYGAKNNEELHNLLVKSLTMTACTATVMTLGAQILSGNIAGIFVGYDPVLFEMTKTGFRIYAISYLICGFNILGSAFFTGLNNGKISALISVFRTFVIQILCLLILPIFFGIAGIWSAIIASEGITLILTSGLLVKYRKKYGY